MKTKLYLKSTFRDIADSKGRFIAIVLIIFLGVLLFVGIKSVGPDLEITGEQLIDETQLADIQVVSTGGLTETDVALMTDQFDATVELGFSYPYVNKEENSIVQLYSYDEDAKQNQLIVTEGRLPQTDNELVLDEKALDLDWSVGDTYTINDSDQLLQSTYTIVGFVQSPVYIDKLERGSANVGDGQVDYFAYIPQKNFSSDTYSIMYVSFDNAREVAAFSQAYKDIIEENSSILDDALIDRRQERKEELQTSALEELQEAKNDVADGQTQLADGKQQLAEAENQLTQQQEQLAQQKAQLVTAVGEEQAQAQVAEAEAQLDAAQQQLAEQKVELTEKEAELADGAAEVNEAEDAINELATPVYYVNPRTNNPGFLNYQSLSERITDIANVFPVFFFFIAILITFTTMTRMVEENRRDIGTLKSLGYSRGEIASKYIVYSLLATILGTVAGVLVGTLGIPTLAFSVFGNQYIFPEFEIAYHGLPIILATIVSLFATVGSSLLVLFKELRERPASLLRPKAPRAGQRILLEYITPLWSRLSFNQKVSYRNLFRFKSRMLLTVVGIAGCTGLMLAGFGLKDSIGAPVERQFNEVVHYQSMVTLNTDGDQEIVADALNQEKAVTAELAVDSQQVTMQSSDVPKQTISLYAIEQADDLSSYVSFVDSNGEKQALPATGAVINDKLAEVFGVKAGETLTYQDEDGQKLTVTIAMVAKNYLGHFMYMSADYFEEVTDTVYQPNSFFVKTADLSDKESNKLAETLNETGEVTNTTFLAKEVAKQQVMTENLTPIVLIFIVLSGTLAFVVLYNLTNINISERVRELATIKVLGFFDNEVTMYIARENVIFTLFGTLFGFGVGNLLNRFILTMASTEELYFQAVIYWPGYVISGLLTVVFSSIVLLVTHFKLKHIVMIDALKSNE